MSLWGNSDGVALTGTVAINQSAVAMTGSSTVFTTEVDIGDLLLIDDLPYFPFSSSVTVGCCIPSAPLDKQES